MTLLLRLVSAEIYKSIGFLFIDFADITIAETYRNGPYWNIIVITLTACSSQEALKVVRKIAYSAYFDKQSLWRSYVSQSIIFSPLIRGRHLSQTPHHLRARVASLGSEGIHVERWWKRGWIQMVVSCEHYRIAVTPFSAHECFNV